jgi:hypothetical protein
MVHLHYQDLQGQVVQHTPGDDPGESPFLRGIINLQDFTADGMKNRWGDNGLDQLTTTCTDWNDSNKFFGYIIQQNLLYGVHNQCCNINQ